MNKQKKNQGPIINSQRRDLKPVDYKYIQELKDKTGVSLEYIKECKQYLKECEETNKKLLENQNRK